MQQEHAKQTRQLQENWNNLTKQQQQRELELKEKEKELVAHREELENERHKLWGDVSKFKFYILF